MVSAVLRKESSNGTSTGRQSAEASDGFCDISCKELEDIDRISTVSSVGSNFPGRATEMEELDACILEEVLVPKR